jgi:hypothetical protein
VEYRALPENNGENRRMIDPERRKNGQFGKGNKGRPPGIPTRKTYEIKEVARQIIDGDNSERAIKKLSSMFWSGKHPHVTKFFLEHRYGKPKETIDLNLTQVHIAAVMELSDLVLGEFLALMREKRHEEALKLLPGGQVA